MERSNYYDTQIHTEVEDLGNERNIINADIVEYQSYKGKYKGKCKEKLLQALKVVKIDKG